MLVLSKWLYKISAQNFYLNSFLPPNVSTQLVAVYKSNVGMTMLVLNKWLYKIICGVL